MKYILLLLFFVLPLEISHAIYDPLRVPNNTYGIHIADPNDIPELPALVNSTGGDWGYVTLVIQDNDRDIGKWQGIFDQMRRLHLIPIVRIATHTEGASWVKPTSDDMTAWIKFLSKLNWPIENRYIVLFNEPNHAKEWGNTINPEEYADSAVAFAKGLKASSNDFFILPAGLDGSAASNSDSLDETEFLRRMYTAEPELFSLLDGWTSHSYPNPAFSGSPNAYGKGTIKNYAWELDYLRQLGITKKLPVFITETGWMHSEGKVRNMKLTAPFVVGNLLNNAVQTAWNDPKIVAVTPFLYNYQDKPFDHFSWKKFQSDKYYDHYFAYQALSKTRGLPRQAERIFLESPLIPDTLISNASYTFRAALINNGQSIVDAKDDFEFILDSGTLQTTVDTGPLPYIEPNQKGEITVHIKIPPKLGDYPFSLALKHHDRTIPLQTTRVLVVPPPKATLSLQLGWKVSSNSKNVTVLIYDEQDYIIQIFRDLKVSSGIVELSAIESIIPEKRYRIVALVPSYLPRQAITVLHRDNTFIPFKRFLPFDFDRNGRLTILDLTALLYHRPSDILKLFF